MREEKKQYLKSYLLQEAKINRLNQMIIINPQNRSEYNNKIIASNKLRNEIEAKINTLNDPLLSELLIQKYILGRTLEEIGYILNYSKRHIERLHIKALEKFEL